MILHGNQRGGGKDLALHLMKDENEKVQVHELRGFVADNIVGAFKESYAISKATRCKQHLFSLSINPPKDADIDNDAFVDAINKTEEKLGLVGQPRAIVFHEKRGGDGVLRCHAHAVWCRIDTENMKAVQLSHSKLKLRDISRDLHIQHDLKMPRGLINSKNRDPRNFSLAEWQQCKRAKKNVHKVKDTFKDCWAVSDSPASFAQALAEHGYILAKGNRGHVVVDYKGEKYPVSRYTDLKAKQVRAKLGEAGSLPSVDKAQTIAAKQVTDRLETLRNEQRQEAQAKTEQAERQHARMKDNHTREAERLKRDHETRRKTEEQQRAKRVRSGLIGFVDRLTGRRKRTLLQNKLEAVASMQRDRLETQTLAHLQEQARMEDQRRMQAVQRLHRETVKELQIDIKEISKPSVPSKDNEKAKYIAKEKARAKRPRRPRTRNRDGPSPGR